MTRPILLLDNYDSFTWNLVTYLAPVADRLRVVRNDDITLEEVAADDPAGILISPGPGRPDGAGLSLELIAWARERAVPLLGVCLGHQALGQVFGARVVGAHHILHGKATPVTHDGKGVFAGLPSPLNVGRYHSLALDPEGLPGDIEVTARAPDGEVMGIRHRTLPLEGVQFHPESVLTPHGRELLANFSRLCIA